MSGPRFQVFALSLVFIPFILLIASFSLAADSGLADRTEQKLEYIRENGSRERPDSHPTQLTEQEINAYLASGKVHLPDGVDSVRLAGSSGNIVGQCRVDFDRVRAGRGNSNPLLRLFSGVHDVVVKAQGSGSNHRGRVQVNSVIIDGIEVPEFVLELFVEKYVTPRYPGVGLDSVFALPDKIETAAVGQHELTVVQK